MTSALASLMMTALGARGSIAMGHPYAAFVGELTGALIGGALWTWLFGMLAGLGFKSQEPDRRALAAAFCGWLVLAVVASFGMGTPAASLMYIPGAIFGYLLLRRRYRELWSDDEDAVSKRGWRG